MSDGAKVDVAIVGLGKMGVSHLAIANASRRLNVVAVCDSFTLLGQMVEKHCGLNYVAGYDDVIKRPGLQAVVIATPTRAHEPMVRQALERGLHVFCEKPMTLSGEVSQALADEAERLKLVCQVGYHNRFVGTFAEVRRLLDLNLIGRVRHVHAEAYGPVVLRPAAKTWRSSSNEGGGCLYDYAAHPINLMNWYVGRPTACIGAQLPRQYSQDVEDAVYSDLMFESGVTGQVSVNWSDETMRKMTTRISIWGDGGKLVADRQELQVFVGATGNPQPSYDRGWTVRNITELTPNVDFYLRGEEYSAQLDGFGDAVLNNDLGCANSFRSAADTDVTLDMIRARNLADPNTPAEPSQSSEPRSLMARMLRR